MRPHLADGWAGANGTAIDVSRWATLSTGLTPTIDIQTGTCRIITGSAAGQDTVMLVSKMVPILDAEVLLSVQPAAITPSSVEIQLRSSGDSAAGSNGYRSTSSIGLELSPNAAAYNLYSSVAGVFTQLGTVNAAYTFSATVKTWIRFRVQGNWVAVKLWQDLTTEPNSWSQAIIDTVTGSQPAGVVTIGAGNNNAGAAKTFNFSPISVTNLADPTVVQRLASPDGNWARLSKLLVSPVSQSASVTIASDGAVSPTGDVHLRRSLAHLLRQLRTPGFPLVGHQKIVDAGSTVASDGTVSPTGLFVPRSNIHLSRVGFRRRGLPLVGFQRAASSGSTVASDGTVAELGQASPMPALAPYVLRLRHSPPRSLRAIAVIPPVFSGPIALTGTGSLSVNPAFLSLDGTAATYVSTPDSAADSITGDIDIRIDVAMHDWTPAALQSLVAKYLGTGNQISYLFAMNTASSGALTALSSPDGTAASVVASQTDAAVGFTDGTRHWIRFHRDVDDGSGHTVDVYEEHQAYNPSIPSSWSGSLIGTAQTSAGTTSIFDGTAEVEVGANNGGFGRLKGDIYRVQILDGAGVVKVDLNPTDWVSGSTWTSSTTGEVWTLHGNALITNASTPTYFAELSGTGSLSAKPTIRAKAALSGSGSLSATALIAILGHAAPSGAGSLAAKPTIGSGPISLSGAGSLAVALQDPVFCFPPKVTLNSGKTHAYASLGATRAIPILSGRTEATPTCTEVPAAVVTPPTSFNRAAALFGVGNLSAAGTPSAVGAAVLTGAGSLAASGTLNQERAAALSGAGSLSAHPTLRGSPHLTGAGSLAATGTSTLSDLIATSTDWV